MPKLAIASTAGRVLIISYELAVKLGPERAAQFRTIIADESHLLKARRPCAVCVLCCCYQRGHSERGLAASVSCALLRTYQCNPQHAPAHQPPNPNNPAEPGRAAHAGGGRDGARRAPRHLVQRHAGALAPAGALSTGEARGLARQARWRAEACRGRQATGGLQSPVMGPAAVLPLRVLRPRPPAVPFLASHHLLCAD